MLIRRLSDLMPFNENQRAAFPKLLIELEKDHIFTFFFYIRNGKTEKKQRWHTFSDFEEVKK